MQRSSSSLPISLPGTGEKKEAGRGRCNTALLRCASGCQRHPNQLAGARTLAQPPALDCPSDHDPSLLGRDGPEAEGNEGDDAVGRDGPGKRKRQRLFPEHKGMSELVAGIKSGKYHQVRCRAFAAAPRYLPPDETSSVPRTCPPSRSLGFASREPFQLGRGMGRQRKHWEGHPHQRPD